MSRLLFCNYGKLDVTSCVPEMICNAEIFLNTNNISAQEMKWFLAQRTKKVNLKDLFKDNQVGKKKIRGRQNQGWAFFIVIIDHIFTDGE